MNAKQLISSLLFVLFAGISSLAAAQGSDADAWDKHNSAFPHTPVQVPFIE